jgi:hypothetical protein
MTRAGGRADRAVRPRRGSPALRTLPGGAARRLSRWRKTPHRNKPASRRMDFRPVKDTVSNSGDAATMRGIPHTGRTMPCGFWSSRIPDQQSIRSGLPGARPLSAGRGGGVLPASRQFSRGCRVSWVPARSPRTPRSRPGGLRPDRRRGRHPREPAGSCGLHKADGRAARRRRGARVRRLPGDPGPARGRCDCQGMPARAARRRPCRSLPDRVATQGGCTLRSGGISGQIPERFRARIRSGHLPNDEGNA